ncbi:hypothetical protein DFH28DRAFT_881118, partial [Melampsora americana]
LIQAGFIGTTLVTPNSVITIRLLQFFHTVWKYCSLQLLPFAEALNDFLHVGNPLFLNRDGTAVSTWIDVSVSSSIVVDMIPTHSHVNGIGVCHLKKSGACHQGQTCSDISTLLCPLPLGEPDHGVCLDGNFQHRNHLAASI